MRSRRARTHDQDGSYGAIAIGGGEADEFFDWPAVRDAIVAYVVRRGHPRHLAEDVAQDTIAALIAYTDERRPGSIYALAVRIAANRLADHFRKNNRFTGELESDPSCEKPLPDRVADGKRKLAILKHAMSAMPSLRREVIVRRRLENQSHARIASDLGLSLSSVEKHVTRGMNDLRKALAAAECRDRIG